jgi:hypothetical protein
MRRGRLGVRGAPSAAVVIGAAVLTEQNVDIQYEYVFSAKSSEQAALHPPERPS